MKHTTHINHLRQKFESNRLFIRRKGNLSVQQYNEFIFESGIRFLEENYPEGTDFEPYYKVIAYDRDFWMWWIVEWRKWEAEVMEWMKESETPFTLEVYLDNMLMISFDRAIEYGFNKNYTKPKLENGILKKIKATAQDA